MAGEKVAKWQIVENVVTAVQRTLGRGHGWVVTPNAYVPQRTGKRRRQVDVYVECPSGSQTFAVGIDVKHKAKPLDVEAMEQLCAKGSKLALDRYIVISTSGYTEQATEEANRHGVVTSTLEELDVGEVLAIQWITTRRAEIQSIEVMYPTDATLPPKEALADATMELADGEVPLGRVAGSDARRWMEEHPEVSAGQKVRMSLTDEHAHWRCLHADGQAWPAPDSLVVTFRVVHEDIPGHLFKTEEGNEVFSAVVPWEDGVRQLTFVILPTEEGSQLVLSAGPVKPGRTPV